MASNTVTTLNGLFKEVYAPMLKWLMPKSLRLQNLVDFVPADQQPGNNFNQPVVLQHEHGFTYAAAGSGAFTISAAIPGQIKNAQVVGSQMLLESLLDYESAHRASNGGKRAYVQATQYMVENMWQSTRKRLEIDLMYGQVGLGTVASVTTAANSVITVTTAEWAPGIWSGMEGAILEFFTAALTTEHVTALTVKILSVDLAARTITVDQDLVTGPPTGGAVAANDVIMFAGQRTTSAHNTMAGLHAILANTGTLFGLSAATYSLWKSCAQSAGAANLSFEVLQRAVAQATGKGLDEDQLLIVNPLTFATLLTDQAALRRHGDPNKSQAYVIGAEGLEFHSQVGKITIQPSIYCKEGYAYLFAPDLFHRVGATDITFRLQDRGDEFFRHHETTAAYALRNYSNQALFTEAPGKACLVSSIDNA